MRTILFLILGAILAGLPCRSVYADTLVLENGDRISGEVVGYEQGWLVFRSALLGEVRVENSRATIVTTSSDHAPSGPAAVPLDASSVTHVEPPAESRARQWKRQLELGLTAQGGVREQTQLSLRVEATRDSPNGSLNLLLSHHYGKSDGYLVTDATRAHALVTRNLSDAVFLRGATRYDRDSAAGVDHDAEQSLGLGYTMVARPTLNLSVGGGAAMRNRSTDGSAAEWDGLLDIFGRLKCAFNDRLSLSQDLSVTATPDDRNDYQLKSHTSLVNKLTDVLHMSLRYEFVYYGAAPAGIAARQRLVTAIGCVF